METMLRLRCQTRMIGISPSCANQLAIFLQICKNSNRSLTYIYSSLENAAFHGVVAGGWFGGYGEEKMAEGGLVLTCRRLPRDQCPVSV